jgi:dTDP-4-amino-4,6-dideoxygalactose transaminase
VRVAEAIRLNDFQRRWREIGDDVREAVERVGASGLYILGPAVSELEAALVDLVGVRCCVGVGNGNDALEIALRSVDLEPGQRVLTTPLSAFATVQAVIRAGGAPAFVDVDATGMLDLDRCEEALAGDPTLRVLLPVHLWGHATDLDRLRDLRASRGIGVVEDCAQSLGARWGGRPVGTVGDAAAVSFYPTKNLGALGDGGAVLTASPRIAERARRLRSYGESERFVHEEVGCNSRLDELHAAILTGAMLPRLERWTTRRREVARRYGEGIDHPLLRPVPTSGACEPVWHLYPVLVGDGRRDAFRRELHAQGIATGIHYPHLIPGQRALAGRVDVAVLGSLDTARSFIRDEVSLPIHPYLSDTEVERVISACNGWRT